MMQKKNLTLSLILAISTFGLSAGQSWSVDDWNKWVGQLAGKSSHVYNFSGKDIAVWGIPRKKVPEMIATIPATANVAASFNWPSDLKGIWFFNVKFSPDIVGIVNKADTAEKASQALDAYLKKVAQKNKGEARYADLSRSSGLGSTLAAARYYKIPIGNNPFVIYVMPDLGLTFSLQGAIDYLRGRFYTKYGSYKDKKSVPYYPNVQKFREQLQKIERQYAFVDTGYFKKGRKQLQHMINEGYKKLPTTLEEGYKLLTNSLKGQDKAKQPIGAKRFSR